MIKISNVSHSYGNRKVLDSVSLEVPRGEIFGLLGPNGSGKTTLLRILSTAFPLTQGEVEIAGFNLKTQAFEIRRILGVVFQSPSLDGKLTVMENVLCQGRLYGLGGKLLIKKAGVMLDQLGVADRAKDRVNRLSGGLKRRVEIAKSLLHEPQLLVLDEPSTGLDPVSRRDVWDYLKKIQKTHGITVLVTTHLMEEAELCGRLAILHQGRAAACGTPEELKAHAGDDVILIEAADLDRLNRRVQEKFNLTGVVEGRTLLIQHAGAAAFVPRLAENFGSEIQSITFRKPGLQEAFFRLTGRAFKKEEVLV